MVVLPSAKVHSYRRIISGALPLVATAHMNICEYQECSSSRLSCLSSVGALPHVSLGTGSVVHVLSSLFFSLQQFDEFVLGEDPSVRKSNRYSALSCTGSVFSAVTFFHIAPLIQYLPRLGKRNDEPEIFKEAVRGIGVFPKKRITQDWFILASVYTLALLATPKKGGLIRNHYSPRTEAIESIFTENGISGFASYRQRYSCAWVTISLVWASRNRDNTTLNG